MSGELAEWFEAFSKSPCYKCNMIDSLHCHTQEEAEMFQFGCDGAAMDACREARRRYMRGPDGECGCTGIPSTFDDVPLYFTNTTKEAQT